MLVVNSCLSLALLGDKLDCRGLGSGCAGGGPRVPDIYVRFPLVAQSFGDGMLQVRAQSHGLMKIQRKARLMQHLKHVPRRVWFTSRSFPNTIVIPDLANIARTQWSCHLVPNGCRG